MNWYRFIFSNNRSTRLARHLAFWLLWWVYFTLSYFHYTQTGLQTLQFEPWTTPFIIKSLLLLTAHIMACYYFISYLMPHYLLTARYLALSIHLLALCLFVLFSSYVIHKELFPLINTAFHYTPTIGNKHIWWTSITSGLLSVPKVICAAAAARLVKRWWMKQKEKERLQKEKLVTDLQLLKAQVHPQFLFSSLDNISILAEKKDTDRASIVLLKLADILSYMLYECDDRFVPLEKEIKIAKDYLLLQKIRMGDRLEMDIAVKGDIAGKKITPLLLLSFIENSFSYINNQQRDNPWINIEFQMEARECTMKIIHGKGDEVEGVTLNNSALTNAVKRLDYFYAGNYELKTTVEPDMMMTCLKIVLEESVNEKPGNIYLPEQVTYAAI